MDGGWMGGVLVGGFISPAVRWCGVGFEDLGGGLRIWDGIPGRWFVS